MSGIEPQLFMIRINFVYNRFFYKRIQKQEAMFGFFSRIAWSITSPLLQDCPVVSILLILASHQLKWNS